MNVRNWGLIYQHADKLTSQEVVSIIKDSVRQRSDLYCKELILREMSSLDFRFYVQKRINQIRFAHSEHKSSHDAGDRLYDDIRSIGA
jgi:hypothetical protein